MATRSGDEAVFEAFGRVVDAIEDGVFHAQNPAVIAARLQGENRIFARDVCANCDARFSCESYRTYSSNARGGAEWLTMALASKIESDEEIDERAAAFFEDFTGNTN